jgi:hypothetical protein
MSSEKKFIYGFKVVKFFLKHPAYTSLEPWNLGTLEPAIE